MEIIKKTIEKDEEYLRQISKEVDFKDKDYIKDVEMLDNFCKEYECFAMASIQIGIPKRIIYLKNTTLDNPIEDKEYNESQIIINPIIISKKGHTRFWEVCASCLDNMGLVNRPYEIVVEYMDINGNKKNKTFTGFEATVFSHEYDHLNGILHTDIAEEIINMPKEQRKPFRELHPYEVISTDCDLDLIIK